MADKKLLEAVRQVVKEEVRGLKEEVGGLKEEVKEINNKAIGKFIIFIYYINIYKNDQFLFL